MRNRLNIAFLVAHRDYFPYTKRLKNLSGDFRAKIDFSSNWIEVESE